MPVHTRHGFCLHDVGVVLASDQVALPPSIDAGDRLAGVKERCKIAYFPRSSLVLGWRRALTAALLLCRGLTSL